MNGIGMHTAKMSSKGRITIRKAVRSRMAVQAGDRELARAPGFSRPG